MTRMLLLSGVLIAAPFATQAADLPPVAAPAPFVAPFSWTGFYAGVNAGYGWGDADVLSTPLPVGVFNTFPVTRGSYDTDGFVGGIQIGYNQQLSSVVLGVEADVNFSGIEGSVSNPLTGGGRVFRVETEIDWFATLRARLGFVPAERLMVYATAGAMMADVTDTTRVQLALGGAIVPQVNYLGSESDVRFGWTVGGGAEYAFTDALSLKAEYLYFDLGENTVIASPQAANPPFQFSHEIEHTGHIARVGLNYRF
ncbi:outer membrane protein [Salinarimonas sp.]|uniref:outer membrane protein n=1 Tax=Salinarimonas sp. TaxID=2766526 RepID=UPI0032D9A191